MPKFNYKIVEIPDGWTLEQIEAGMNQAGDKGWMIQQLINKANKWLAIFTKKIAD